MPWKIVSFSCIRYLFTGCDRLVMRINSNLHLPLDIQRHFRICVLTPRREAYLAVWFTENAESSMERLWRASPSAALILHDQMIQSMFAVLKKYVPQISFHGCAPIPLVNPTLKNSLKKIGISFNNAHLDRTYATITFWPWKGGCSMCALEKACPKSRTEYWPASFEQDVKNSIFQANTINMHAKDPLRTH